MRLTPLVRSEINAPNGMYFPGGTEEGYRIATCTGLA